MAAEIAAGAGQDPVGNPLALADRGIVASSGRTRRELLGGAARAARVDRTLAEAGIGPGDPSLYPRVVDPEDSP